MTGRPEMESPFSIAPIPFDLETVLPLIDSLVGRLRGARAVQIVGHLRPDGDCLGSMVAARRILGHWGVPSAMAALDLSPYHPYGGLQDFDLVRAAPDPELDADLVLFLDCSNPERGMPGLPDDRPVLNIDHHGSNSRYGEINWIEPKCAAVGEMLFYLAERVGVPIDTPLAEALMIAISTDTGGFRFGNTGPAQHRIAARLLECGASIERVNRAVHGNRLPDSMRLTGRVLNALHLECGNQLVWSQLRCEDFEACGGEAMAPENLANNLRDLRGVRVALLFSETGEDSMRVNFRSDGSVDVCALAAPFGGGGHAAAAGLSMDKAVFERDRDAILQAVRAALD